MKFLIVRQFFPGQREDLQRVIQGIPLGMKLPALGHPRQWQQQRSIDREAIDPLGLFQQLAFQFARRGLPRQQLLQLGNRTPLDRPPGDRTEKHFIHLRRAVDRQLKGVQVGHMDVGVGALRPVFANLFPLDPHRQPLVFQQGLDARGPLGEQVDVDVGPLTDMTRPDAANQPGAILAEQPHHPQSLQPHRSQPVCPGLALEHPGQLLDLLADFGVAGEFRFLDPVSADFAGRADLRPLVLGFVPGIHQPGRLKGDLPSQLVATHERTTRLSARNGRIGAVEP